MTFIFSKPVWLACLCAITLLGHLPAVALAEVRMVDGREIRDAITTRLAAAGKHAAPNVLAEKQFYLCDQPLRVEPAFGGWRSVDVICESPTEWKISVRAQVPGHFEPHAPVSGKMSTTAVFLTRPLRSGDRILPDDVELRPIDPLSAGSVYEDPTQVIGRMLNQSLTTRSPVMPRHLAREWSVNESDVVSLRIVRGGIEIMSSGIALDKGQFGDTIRAQNPRSGRILVGRIIGEKKLEILAKGFN